MYICYTQYKYLNILSRTLDFTDFLVYNWNEMTKIIRHEDTASPHGKEGLLYDEIKALLTQATLWWRRPHSCIYLPHPSPRGTNTLLLLTPTVRAEGGITHYISPAPGPGGGVWGC